MHRSGWTPSIVPREDEQAVYLVMDDRGERGLSGAKPTPPAISKP